MTGAERKALEGAYRREGKHGPARVEVVQRTEGLYLVVPGQLPPFPLRQVSRAHFHIEGTAGERLVFELERGAVRRLRLESKAGGPIVTFRPLEKSR